MLRLAATTVAVAVCLALAPAAQQAGPPPQQPGLTFRTVANYVEVDAIVTDAAGDPVRDLTCKDFVVTEDGRPQNLNVCAFVDIPVARPDPPLYKDRPIQPDVFTNAKAFDGRVFMIVLDGFHVSAERGLVVRREAAKFIDRYLGENDVAAVVHVGNPGAGQEFTANKTLLKAAVNRFAGQSLPSITASINRDALAKAQAQAVDFDPGPAIDTDSMAREYMARESMDSVRRLSDYLSGLTGRRKAVLLFSEGIATEFAQAPQLSCLNCPPQADTSSLRLSEREMIAAAARNNVSIYSIDPRGLSSGMDDAQSIAVTPSALPEGSTMRDYSNRTIMNDNMDEVRRAQEHLREFAEQTGGLAMVNKNDMDDAFRRIVQDNSSYYVLGYQSPDPRHDGRFHRTFVKVTRPGLQVRTRNGYYAPGDVKESKGPFDPIVGMLSSPLAVSGLGMRSSASVIKGLLDKPSVLLTIEFDGKDVALKQAAGYFTNDIDLQYLVVDMKGVTHVNVRDQAQLKLRPETKERFPAVGARVVMQFELDPGRYQVRVAAREQLGGKSGSVFMDIEVPDFTNAKLSMSDILLTSSSALRTPTPNNTSTMGRVLSTPTTVSRTFTNADTLTAAVSIYDGDTRASHGVDYKASLRGDAGGDVFTREEHKDSADFSPAKGGMSWVLDIPLKGIAPGRYVLVVEAQSRLSGVEPVRRETEIKIK